MQQGKMRRNISYLMRFMALLVFMIAAYSVIFHYIMEHEGRSYSWITGVYWTLTVMSTLGFGDITFVSDAGRLFSLVVLMTGVIFLLVMLPFTFIQYFYAPWLEAQRKEMTPRSLPAGTSGHVILVGLSPMILNLVDDLTRYGVHCVLLCPDSQTTLDVMDQGYHAVMGEYDNGETYRRLRIGSAAMVVALDSDVRNTNIAFTVREEDPNVPITARVENVDAIDILHLAGSTSVFQFHKLLGEALARRVLRRRHRASVLNRFETMVVAEATVMRTPLVGQTLRDCGLRHKAGVNVVGLWERGKFHLPGPDTRFTDNTVVVVAGTPSQIDAFDSLLTADTQSMPQGPVVVLGGGRVGLAAVEYLENHGRNYVVVDKSPRTASRAGHEVAAIHEGNAENPRGTGRVIHGDAADLEILEDAGIRTAPSVIITTHDDDTNIYLTIYCRRLRPDIQIISRATLDRNVGILHAAGADLVLSLATMLTNNIINLLSPGKVFMLNEGLNIFSVLTGPRLVGKTLLASGIRDHTNCSVVAIRTPDETMHVNPDPSTVFGAGDTLFLIGDSTSESSFYKRYSIEGQV